MKDKILLIDDKEEILIGLKMLISREGFDIYTASSYHQAKEEMKWRDFDLVITDYELKDKTGIDLLKEVKRRKPNCPVILYTGTLDDKIEFEAKQMGAYEYLTKPVKLETLLGIIQMALHHKRVFHEVCTAVNE